MKNLFITFVALLATSFAGIAPVFCQNLSPVMDTVIIGSNNEVYLKLLDGTKTSANRKQWDIAFHASRMSASILTNDAATTNPSGNYVGVELFTYPKSDTSGWATIDTSGLYTWKIMVNSTTDWETGAFCQYQKGHPDYGWGVYNSASHDVVGDSLYIIRLRDGSLRKLWIVRKYSSENIIKIRYAYIDGTHDTSKEIDCNPFASKNFVGYSLETDQVVDFEPVISNNWDLLFTKYVYTYPDKQTTPVTGVLSNFGIKVNKFQHVGPDFRLWDVATMDSTRSPIGFDWKAFTNGVYVIEDSLAYFVQDKSHNIHKIVFKGYAGGSTGRFVFQREMISAAGIFENEKSDVNAVVYPNPVKDVLNLIINPGQKDVVMVSILDMSGRPVLSNSYKLPTETLSTLQIPVTNVPAGLYLVRIQVGTEVISRKVIVNN